MIRRSIITFTILGIITFALAFWYGHTTWLQLGNPAIGSGYTLLGLMLLLGFFNIRKRLSMLPVGRGSLWLAFHVVAGVLAIAMFWLHTGTIWPEGTYEQVLTVLFYLVSLTGVLGYIILRGLPRRLTQTGIEVMYERIPMEIGEIREKVEALSLECTEKTGSDTVAQHYMGTLNWFFQRPRFGVSHLLGGDAAGHWLRGPGTAARRYLNNDEKEYFDQILELGAMKVLVDRHYVCQDLMKKWLLVHVPLSMAVILLSIWHFLLVNVYAL